MNRDEFRYMRRGKQFLDLKDKELQQLLPVRQSGDKKDRVLLLLHGFSSSPAVFRYLLPNITAYDALVCPALPGHAESIEAFSRAKSSDWLAQVSEICKGLTQEFKTVDVLGLSLGGLLALQLSQFFDINRLYLLAPALRLQGSNINFLIRLAVLLKTLGFKACRNGAGNILGTDYAEIAYRTLPLSVIIEILRFIKNYQWSLPNCPVELFLGEKDAVVDSKQVEALLQFPGLRVHRLMHSAHVLPLDNDVQQIIDCINTKL